MTHLRELLRSVTTYLLTYILYPFLHIARYWSKIDKFIYLTCIQRPYMRLSRRYIAKTFSILENRNDVATATVR